MSPRLKSVLPSLWFALLTLAIVAPWWFRSGYVWLLDSVWGPHQAVDFAHPTANLPWQIVTHALTVVLSGPVAEKFTLSAVLLAAGLSGYYLGRRLLSPGWATAAGTLYMLNPFVYDRLLAGQWIVLAGYALLPVSLAWAHDILTSRGRTASYRLAILIAIYPWVSPHFAFINVFMLIGYTLVYVVLEKPAWLWSRKTAIWAAATLAAVAAANWFWVQGSSGRAYQSFSTVDFNTFRTASDPVVGVWGNVLFLYGFWRGAAFVQPKTWLGPVWLLLALLILILAIAGAVRAWRRRQPLAISLALAAPIALVLAIGYASPFTKPLTEALMHGLPGYRGLRDTGKLIGVLALSYAVLATYGAAAITGRLRPPQRLVWLAPASLMLIAVINVTGLIPGASGQVALANYPPGYLHVADILQNDPNATVVVLPWHNYLSLNFANNTYAAQPAPVLFANPLLSSDETDAVLAARPDTPADRLMQMATSGQISPQSWAAGLRHLGARYLVLEKTDDYASYQPLISDAGLNPVYQDSTIGLYHF